MHNDIIMKKFYFSGLAFILMISLSCSKSIADRYTELLEGRWRIADVDRAGWAGGSTAFLPFQFGSFEFRRDGTVTHVNEIGEVYTGTWNVETERENDLSEETLELITVNFTSQHVLGEFYRDINFIGRNHVRMLHRRDGKGYVTHLRRL